MEVWGGNQKADRHLEMPGLEAWIFSQPHLHAQGGGDVYYVSSCSSGRITRILLADVSGHGVDASKSAVGLRELMRRNINIIRQNRFVAEMNKQFSEFAASQLKGGDTLQAMPPAGRFHVDLDPSNEKDYVGFAAGSGITPILSMIKSILTTEMKSRFILFYGNRKQSTTMFIEDLYALKNLYPERLQLHFVFSQEEQEFPISSGRLDAAKVKELFHHFCAGIEVDDAFVCGPNTMIEHVTEALLDIGIADDHVHFERFGPPRKKDEPRPGKVKAADHATITVIMDGHKKEFEMHRDDANIVDAAADNGIDLPYSCKGGVCATCRCHVREGEVTMASNYGLEPWEVDKGYALACQSRPVSDSVTLDYDKT